MVVAISMGALVVGIFCLLVGVEKAGRKLNDELSWYEKDALGLNDSFDRDYKRRK